MKASELTTEVKVLHERTEHLKRVVEQLDKDNQYLREQFNQLNIALAKTQQQLADHIVHVEKWDARRWATIGFFIAGLIALVANLVLAIVRK